MTAKRRIYCPSCGSDDLRALGSNGIEPKPGYACGHCSQKLRRRGSAWFYVVIVGLGLVMLPVGVGFLIWGFGSGTARFLLMGGVGSVGGVICFVYAVLRLCHPVPLLVRPELDYRPPARPQPTPEPTEPPAPADRPEPALPVWRVSGVLNRTGFAVIREVEAESGLDAATVAELDGMTVTQVDRIS